jgi:hypothetical protein
LCVALPFCRVRAGYILSFRACVARLRYGRPGAVCVFFSVALDLVARTPVCGGDAGAPPLRVRRCGAVFLSVSGDVKLETKTDSR